MSRFYLASIILFFVQFVPCSFSQENPEQFDFSGATVEINQVQVMGAGFGAYPQADISFGYIPTDNAFSGATDGVGAIIQADPGEGIMIMLPVMDTTQSAIIRCSVRASG